MKPFAFLLGLLLATPAFASDHVVVLLDTSGSMSESMRTVRVTKMKAAHQALQKVVDQMPATTKLGLLTFDGWAFHLGTLDKSLAQRAILTTNPAGSTPLGQYMKMGADELLSAREKEHGVGTYTLLVVTDGEATDGELMDLYTPDIVSRGITLKTIGMDLGRAHTLAARSVRYFPANDLQSLEGALSQAIAEVPAGNDNIDEDAYAMISGIPADMTPQLLEAITGTITYNQPIGEKPKVKVVDQQGNVTFVTPLVEEEQPSGKDAAIVIGLLIVLFLVSFLVIAIKNREI